MDGVRLEQHDPAAGRPWGLWATVGCVVAVAAAFVTTQQGVAIVYLSALMAAHGEAAANASAADPMADGTLLALVTLASSAVCTALVVVIAWLRRDLPVRSYLALRPPTAGQLAAWIGAIGATIALTDLLTYALGRPVVPEYLVVAYRSCGILPLLWLAMGLAAPVFEEIFVRGFIFAGLESSRVGGPGAVVVTALLWTVVHSQYGLYELAIVFVMGLILGAARLRTGSVIACIAMHVLANLVATVEVAVTVSTA